jgi:membrane-bound lytic murein transglycosylase D
MDTILKLCHLIYYVSPVIILFSRIFLSLLCLALIQGCSTLQSQPIEAAQPAPLLLTKNQAKDTSTREESSVNTSIEEPDDLWQRVRDQYQLDLSVDNKRITAQLNWYKRHQNYLNRVSDRAKRYMYFIMEQIEVRDMPGEMALLPIVESAFDPFAYSHGRASGVWQFIPSTGKIYGLKQNWWYDGRRDIRRSTIAALKFLKGLSREFNGDWTLALAAYNSGAGTVRKAIRKNKRKGLPTDFWSLSLPKETRAYAPKLLALAKLLKEPEKYGISFPKIENKPYFAVVNTQSQMDLSQAAQMAQVDLEEIYKLNPQFNQWATSPNGPHELLIPIEQTNIMQENLENLPVKQRIKWQRYKVKSGDSLITIAKKFRTTPQALKQVNPIQGDLLRIGDMLLIPTAFKNSRSYTYSAGNRLNKKQARSRGPKNSQKINYKVQAGDSFWSLSKKHNVPVGSIAKWNGMAPKDPLKPGQKLVIWSKSKLTKQDREIIRKVRYRVRNGDSLHRIANKFNVRVKDIKRWNQINKKKYLQPGDELILYVDVTQAG